MLGYVMTEDRGATDRLLAQLADGFEAEGRRLAGAVQINTELPDQIKCRMELRLLPSGEKITISQSLGALAQGCRLDPDGLERAVHHAEKALEAGAELVLINKFGKQEIEGRGFRDLIAAALSEGIPVLLGINTKNFEAFEVYAGDFAEPVEPNLTAMRDWCLGKM
ncbi:DUF2478 domain-containing protein [Celeribacter persicus]|uniref:Uncharacterized protein DUF2478 n=1 Tax=Celeribacter persicus TaxID=1651082 RepID=A0A2T5HWM2_9RHOB|nr:DUF2478 domain-containing protein [Celeribacter persicus]PTQ75976.1 uncharacterized protein DUF2478 [Celeribacter persicus]